MLGENYETSNCNNNVCLIFKFWVIGNRPTSGVQVVVQLF